VLERGEGHRLGLGGEVVRHPHQAQRVDEGRVGGEVPETAPARANALLIVRVTTSRGRPSSRVRALGVPGRANSA
jgi:hypothetical protein